MEKLYYLRWKMADKSFFYDHFDIQNAETYGDIFQIEIFKLVHLSKQQPSVATLDM